MRKILFTIVALIFTASLGYSQVTTLWEKSTNAGTKPAWESGSLTRGLSYGSVGGNDLLFVVTRNAGLGGKQIIYFNALTGDSLGQLDNTGIAGGVAVVNDVEVSSDGKIFVGNMTTNASADAFKVYRYDSLKAAPVAVISYNATAVRLGDKFTVTGSTADNSIVIWVASSLSTAGAGVLLKFTTVDNGATFTSAEIPIAQTASSAAVGPLTDGSFYHDAHGTYPTKYSAEGTAGTSFPNTVIATSGSAIRYLTTFLGDEYVLANELLTTTNNAKIIKVVGGVPTAASIFASTPVLGATSAGGLGDVSVQKVSNYVYNVYVLATNNGFGAYHVDLRVPLTGDYYIPKGTQAKGFANLVDAVASLNINGATGTVNFLLDADTLRENSITFNADLSATNNVVVKPAAGRNVCLIVTPGASMGNGSQMIGFDKGYVTFDGSNDGSTSRNLIVTTEADDARVPFGLNKATADTVVLKNLIIKNLDNVALNFRYGAVVNDVGGVWGFRVENCQIGTPERPIRRDALAPWGGSSTANNFTFLNNEIYTGVRGVATIYLEDSEISGNTINIIPTMATGGSDAYNHGIYITGAVGNTIIHENTINCLSKTTIATTYLVGIAFAGNGNAETDIISVVNNMINMGAADENRYVYGIGLRSAQNMGNLKVYHNTIVINNTASTLVSYGIGNHTNGTGPVNIDLKDNIIINNHSGNVGSSAIGVVPATSVLTSDYNLLLANQNLVNYQGTTYADLTAWQATSQDANSVSKAVNFVSATDLHLAGTSNGDVDLAGTPIAGITTDIDGDTRNLTSPYKGADEGTIPLAKVPDLFISEYIEGSSNNKAMEIYNPTGVAVDLAKYRLVRANNGSAVVQYIQPLFGTLASADVYVIANPSAAAEIMAVADLDTGSVTFYNGDDYMGLEKDVNGTWTVIDVIGRLGEDPGTNWPVAGGIGATSEFTLVRKDYVLFGNTDWTSSAGTNADNSEWLVYPQNTFAYLGNHVIPVELTSFVANIYGKNVVLNWSTATETNNSGFEVERKSASSNWTKVGFVAGFGTTSEIQHYSFIEKNLATGNYSYRLKQVDFDGKYSYSQVVEVSLQLPNKFELSQNFPNPFNPTTKINYTIPVDSRVTLQIFAITGELVKELVNENQSAGTYIVDFNASDLANGTYIYRINAGGFVQARKMMLIK